MPNNAACVSVTSTSGLSARYSWIVLVAAAGVGVRVVVALSVMADSLATRSAERNIVPAISLTKMIKELATRSPAQEGRYLLDHPVGRCRGRPSAQGHVRVR